MNRTTIFSHRSLQRMLSNIAKGVVPKKRATHLASAIKEPGFASIEATWEVVVVYALSKIAHLTYEPPTKGPTKPDLLLESLPITSSPLLLDTTVVEDRGLEDQNPLEVLYQLLTGRARRMGIIPNRL